jgi:hypothetical protein
MRDVKLYTRFEEEVAPRPAATPQAHYTIVQYGFPGSGSTFVWQILNAVFGHAAKTHLCPDYREDFRVVATVRDFRDVLCTYLHRADLPPTREGIDFIVDRLGAEPFENLFKMDAVWGGRPNILWLRYERFVGDFDYLFTQIEAFFALQIPEDWKRRCREEFSLDANRERSRTADALCNRREAKGWLDRRWTQYTIDGINGLHVTGGGGVEKWQRAIPEELHPHLHARLRPALERFGYL